MAEERSSRFLSLAPQFGSLAVVLAIAAAVIPGANKPHETSTAPIEAVLATGPAEGSTPQDA